MKKIFISHSSHDKYLAETTVSFLESEGYDCWYAPRNIDSQIEWPAELVKAIKHESEVLLLLMSEFANTSAHVKREVSFADASGVRIIGIKLNPSIDLNETIDYFLSIHQWYHCIGDDYNSLAKEIANHVIEQINHPQDFTNDGRQLLQSIVSAKADYIARGYEAQMDEALDDNKIVVLTSEGGMGKTCLAVNYYASRREKYKYVIFVNSETPNELIKSLKLSSHLKVTELKNVIIDVFEHILQGLTEDDDRVLLIMDNYSYDRNEYINGDYEQILAEILRAYNKSKKISIIVTTRLPQVSISDASIIKIGDFTLDQGLEYLQKNLPEEIIYDEESAVKLIQTFGVKHISEHDSSIFYTIPAINCVSIKNSIVLTKKFKNIDGTVKARQTLDELMLEQIKLIENDTVHSGNLFSDILKIASFLNGTNIKKSLLFEILLQLEDMRGIDVSEELFDRTIEFYNAHITLLNKVEGESVACFKIHKCFQDVLNEQVFQERRFFKHAIIKVLQNYVHPFSYYGTHTLADENGIMSHILSLYEMVKNERNEEEFFTLVLAVTWYYGYIIRNGAIYKSMYEYLMENDNVPLFYKCMASCDYVLIPSDQDSALPEYYFEDIEFDIEELDEEFADIAMIRLELAKSYYEFTYGIADKAKEAGLFANELCDEFLKKLIEKRGHNKYFYIYAIEAKSTIMSRLASINRSKYAKYDESIRCTEAAREIFSDRRYNRYVRDLKMKDHGLYLEAFAYNLEGVTLMEEGETMDEYECFNLIGDKKSIERLYKSESLNQSALDLYRDINHKPAIQNQEINFVNIYRVQAEIIIDKVNVFINPENEILTTEEWKERYNTNLIVPNLKDKYGNLREVTYWINEFFECMQRAKDFRDFAKKSLESYNAPLSEAFHNYLFALSLCEVRYHAYSDSKKNEILDEAVSGFTVFHGKQVKDGLDQAIEIVSKRGDRSSMLYRYKGYYYRRKGDYAKDFSDKIYFYRQGIEIVDRAIEVAQKTNYVKALINANGLKKILENKLKEILEV